MTKETKTLPSEGIHFGMKDEEYFALPYFSRSFSEDILFDDSGEEAKHKLKNPMVATPAMDLGTALHSAILEEKDFNKTYIVQTVQTDPEFKDKIVLDTTNDLKPYLTNFGLKKSGLKGDLVNSLREFLDPAEYVFWDDVKAEFLRKTSSGEKKVLTAVDYATCVGLKSKLKETERLKAVFSDGYPEVTLIWKDPETGVLCKCRLDYLRWDLIGEFKSFSVKDKKISLMKNIFNQIQYNKYHFQFAIYLNALELLIEKIKKGEAQVFGDVDPEWLEKLLETPVKRSFVVFGRTQAPYQMRGVEIHKISDGNESMNAYFSVAENMWRAALNDYILILKEEKGVEEIINLEDFHVPSVMYQNEI